MIDYCNDKKGECMKIQVLSDLHLEFADAKFKYCETDADVIALAGDIGNYQNVIEVISKTFPQDKDIVYVAGNHEFYGTSLQNGYSVLKNEAKKYPNIHFLENDVFEKEDTVFLGTTLWTDFNLFNNYHAIADTIKYKINDFSRITTPSGNRISTEIFRERFYSSLDFLENSIKKHKGEKIVIVTHHLPTIKGIPLQFLTAKTISGIDPTSAAFASNLEYFIKDYSDSIKLWIHGHSHYNYNPKKILIEKTVVTCNQFDYPFVKPENFDPCFKIEV